MQTLARGGPSGGELIWLDDTETFPSRLRSVAEELASAFATGLEDAPQVSLPAYAVERVLDCLEGASVGALHATRLLPGERERIAREGLAGPSRELHEQKLKDAVEAGALSAEFARQILSSEAESISLSERQHGVCLATTREALANPGFRRPALVWGGEALWQAQPSPVEHRLRAIGSPLLIEVHIPAGALPEDDQMEVAHHCVAAMAGLNGVGPEVRVPAVLPAWVHSIGPLA